MDYMGMLSRIASMPRRMSMDALDWINDNPLPAAGATMAALAGSYLIMLIHNAASTAGTTIGHLESGVVLGIARTRPVYVLAIIVGISILTRWRE
jgi:hypothetical protein